MHALCFNASTKRLLILLLLVFASFQSHAQLGRLGDLVNKNVGSVLNSKSLKILNTEPISTKFEDCDQSNLLPVDFGKDSIRQQLCDLTSDYNKATGFKLKPGFYTGTFKSFCLQAGTYGPSKGDGYLFAPLAGTKEKTARTLIANWEAHPEIEQSQVQVLLWALLAKTNFSKLAPDLQVTAGLLLSDKDLSALGSTVVDYLSAEAMASVTANLPAPAKQLIELENKIRGVMYQANSSYADIESLAMLVGAAPVNDKFPRGIWSYHPDGYYIKYLPKSYQRSVVEIYVPEKVGIINYLPVGDVAVPASRGSQRLGQSNVLVCDEY